ncbi:hypothetical protein SKAU_G00262110 [Synaphobranchus kaupii]|uniref:L27 domain-containing protein n=1 Tax=Synaphobranchus kaupii TaxID=118154 RepID=A0A9Q1EYL9_SYNKA|nr:hypothetical protein SKAU_G00262110 [Synaphobranchus kaupii]
MLFSTTLHSKDCQEARMPVRKKDTARALGLLEDYCTKLRKPEEQQLKTAILRVMGIFKSSLFQALLDIQEFYEVTLLNTQKSCEEKLEEVNNMAAKWERAGSPTVILQHPCPGDESRDLSSSEQNGTEQAQNSTAQQYQQVNTAAALYTCTVYKRLC